MSDRVEAYRKLSTSGESLYLTLGVEKPSTVRGIKDAYKKLKRELRLDKKGKTVEESTKRVNDVNRAYAVLSDRQKKEIYDSNGSLGVYLVENFGERDANAFCVVASGWSVAVFLLCGSVFYSLLSCFCCCCCCCNLGCDSWRSSPDQGQDLVAMSGITVPGIGEEKK